MGKELKRLYIYMLRYKWIPRNQIIQSGSCSGTYFIELITPDGVTSRYFYFKENK